MTTNKQGINSMKVKMTENGKKLLEAKIADCNERLRVILSQKGDAYENGGNGWHDNFAFEQLTRDEASVASELTRLTNTLHESETISAVPASYDTVQVGCAITLLDQDGKEYQYRIVGYGETDLKSSPKKLEYLAPIVLPFFEEQLDAEHEVKIAGIPKTLTLVSIKE